MKTYDEMSEACGLLGSSGYYDWCLVRDGDDVVALYNKDETCRWTPAGIVTVTVPQAHRKYFQRAIWGRRLTRFCGVAVIGRQRNLSTGPYFTFALYDQTYKSSSRIEIDTNTRKVTVLDPIDTHKVDRRKAKKVVADAAKVIRAATATSQLTGETRNYGAWRQGTRPEILAQQVHEQKVGEIATTFSACPWGVHTTDQTDSWINIIKHELYRISGAVVPSSL